MDDPDERPMFIPHKDLNGDKETDTGSFDLRILMECINLIRKKTTSAEACLMHIIFLRGWMYGNFSVPQSALALQAGVDRRTVAEKMKAFQEEGLIRIRRKGNKTLHYTLTYCDLIERAVFLFRDRERREELFDAYVAEQNKKKGKKQETEPEEVSEMPPVTPSDVEEGVAQPDLDVSQAKKISEEGAVINDELDRIWEELEVEANQRGKPTPEEVRDEYVVDRVEAEAERDRLKQQMKDRLASAMKKRAEQRRARFDLLDDGEGVSEAS